MAELLVGLAVTSVVLTAVVAIFLGVQRSYQAETEVKGITENGRGAMTFIERVLPLAGYGLDPRVAFDVSLTETRDNQLVNNVTFSPTPPAIPGAVGTVVTDDLAFRFRDPAFLRAGRLSSSTQVTIDTPLELSLGVGKLLMVACRGGADFAMVRVSVAAVPSALTIAVVAAGAPFVANAANCLSATGATASPSVFLVQEHRLRIVNLGGRPWLVSFRNLEDSVTNLALDNFDPIAPDVESFQVAFGMNRARPALTCCQTAVDPSPGNVNHIVGDALLETFFAQPVNVLRTAPEYRTGYDKVERYARHPANIRSVHVAFVMRSTRPLPERRELQTGDLFNYDAPAVVADSYRRSKFQTAVSTPNLLSRSAFTPALRSATSSGDFNSWGG